tara:strand:+ start:666 stop:962 length:297 start_codon:yes stop_codon:yes gene_type:complete
MTVKFWTPKCMWPSQVEEPREDDGAIILCNSVADYLVDGYSYCETHVKACIKDHIDYAENEYATREYDGYSPISSEQLQDYTDNEATGEWSYNGGGDE